MSTDPRQKVAGSVDPGDAGALTDLEAVADGAPLPMERDGRVYLVARREGRSWVIDLEEAKTVTIGRAPDSTVVLDETRVSRHHARIARTGPLLTVEDLGSRNGTRLDGDVLRGARKALFGGEVVAIGRLELTVATAARPSTAAGAPGRLEAELARLVARKERGVLVRIAIPPGAAARVLGAMTEALAAAELVEQRAENEYAALLPGNPPALSNDVDRLRAAEPSARVTAARIPDDGHDFATLWRHARAADGEETEDLATDAVVADAAMVQTYRVARRLAQAESTVLIVGETGAGKEVMAEFIHRSSRRANGPFVRLNCASLPETLLESELFGHERGAFTGAERRKIGYLEAANTGTLLLDEIGELPLGVQAKFLRALETHRAPRVGGTQEVAFDVRFLCATHRDLQADVGAGKFRQDLYFRVRALSLKVPPLRERPTEIALLAQLFARSFATQMGVPAPAIEPDVMAALLGHGWPGNVRELKHAMEHAVLMAEDSSVALAHLPDDIAPRPSGTASSPEGMRGELADIERRRIIEALEKTAGNQTRAAVALGISRRNLLYKLTKYGLRG